MPMPSRGHGTQQFWCNRILGMALPGLVRRAGLRRIGVMRPAATPPVPRPATDRADLHLHTTCSDGSYTPAQIVDLARRSGLAAIAVTDHDTVAGVAPARQAAGQALEIVPALELTAHHRGKELHLLGYFLR